jgi:hypothetical protein
MQRPFMLSISAIAMICAGDAAADSSHLTGTYGFTGTDACLYASAGFNASLQALGTAFSASFADEGVRTFNRDGTGTFTNSSTTITVPPTVGSCLRRVPPRAALHSSSRWQTTHLPPKMSQEQTWEKF